jgi:hypothetical protein
MSRGALAAAKGADPDIYYKGEYDCDNVNFNTDQGTIAFIMCESGLWQGYTCIICDGDTMQSAISGGTPPGRNIYFIANESCGGEKWTYTCEDGLCVEGVDTHTHCGGEIAPALDQT